MPCPISATESPAAPSSAPFAKPPGKGLSSSTVNVLWGFFNLAIAYLLVCRVGSFNLQNTLMFSRLGAGMVLISVMSARAFGRFHGGLVNLTSLPSCRRRIHSPSAHQKVVNSFHSVLVL